MGSDPDETSDADSRPGSVFQEEEQAIHPKERSFFFAVKYGRGTAHPSVGPSSRVTAWNCWIRRSDLLIAFIWSLRLTFEQIYHVKYLVSPACGSVRIDRSDTPCCMRKSLPGSRLATEEEQYLYMDDSFFWGPRSLMAAAYS